MWLTSSDCEQVISQAWAYDMEGDAVDKLVGKLGVCTDKLAEWNKAHFGHVGRKIHKLEQQLRETHDIFHRRDLLSNIRDWRRKEEILWWQRAKSDYLCYGDANTRWFHSRASMRQTSNTIEQPLNKDGILQSDPIKIDNTVIAYFSSLFSSSGGHNMDAVLEGMQPKDTTVMNDVLCAPYTRQKLRGHCIRCIPTKHLALMV